MTTTLKDLNPTANELRICPDHSRVALLIPWTIGDKYIELLYCPSCVSEVVNKLLRDRISTVG